MYTATLSSAGNEWYVAVTHRICVLRRCLYVHCLHIHKQVVFDKSGNMNS